MTVKPSDAEVSLALLKVGVLAAAALFLSAMALWMWEFRHGLVDMWWGPK